MQTTVVSTMNAEAKNAAEEYKLTLMELSSNNKTQINLLTILAEDYRAFAEAIVNTIEQHIYTVKPTIKLVVVYVCDSILKNVKGVYVDVFNKCITKIFLHTFQNGNEQIRAALYKVRMTWSEIFPASRLYQIDMKVNSVDSAWPIANPKTGRALRNDPEVKVPKPAPMAEKVLVNRKFVSAATTTPSTTNRPDDKKIVQSKEASNPLDRILPADFKDPVKPSTSSGAPKRKADTLVAPVGGIKKRVTPPFNNGKDQDHRSPDEDLRKLRPTATPGSHAFSIPPQAPNMLPLKPPTLAIPAKPVITSGSATLNIPENNKLFIENKAYEVYFIGDVALIEKTGGLPHRVYFEDNPHDILIDNVPYRFAFGVNRMIKIDGMDIEVGFGAPSRELMVGGVFFRGQWQGPSILVQINGKTHAFKFAGSAPMVRIDNEPSYELVRELAKVKAERQLARNPVPEPPADPFALLKKLKKNGYLKPQMMQQEAPAPAPVQQQQPPRIVQPLASPSSIPDRVDVQRRPEPPSLKDFNIRLLSIRYDSVVTTLLTKRSDACKTCGMLMDGTDQTSAVWREHMDWHVKRNLSKQDTVYWQQWYPSDTVWLTPRMNEKPSDQNEKPQPPQVQGVVAEDIDHKDCPICHEKFEEYYDDEEETWRLRDTVKAYGKTVHTACAADVTVSEIFEDSKLSIKQEPHSDDDNEDKKPATFDSKDFLATLIKNSQKC